MGDAERLAAEFERVHTGDSTGEAWHGPALRPVLSRIDAATAAARPIPGAHGAAEVVAHIAAWRDFATGLLEGRRDHPPEDGWPRIESLTVAEWDAIRARCDASMRRLAAAIRAADPARLEKCRDSLQFVLHHDLYHAGQVGLLQRAQP